MNFKNKAQADAMVTMVALKADLFQTTKTDHKGNFKFNGIVIADSIRITFQARSQNNSSRVELQMDTLPGIRPISAQTPFGINYIPPPILEKFAETSKKVDSIYEKAGQFSRVQRLKEVSIKGRKSEQKFSSQGMLSIPEGHSDMTINMENEKNFATMESFIRERVSGSGVRYQPYKPEDPGPEAMVYPWAPASRGVELVPMQIIVDGMKLEPTEAIEIFTNSTLDVRDIAKIEVVVTGALMGMLGGPSIMFYTKADKFIRKPDPNVVNLSLKGYNKVKSFYNPKYDTNDLNKLPDLRSTIYWNADIRLDSSGKASFNYFNGDGPGSYKSLSRALVRRDYWAQRPTNTRLSESRSVL